MQYNKRSYRLETSLKYHFVALKLIQQSSSLRMIGIRSCISNRITPACAGKRCSPYLCFWGVIDHPCVCREKIVEPCNILAPAGSPLRVQGKVILFGCIDWRYRITPACAGKSHTNNTACGYVWDHPCVCREKSCLTVWVVGDIGSPLRVQGKACFPYNNIIAPRITPACAGKRRFSPWTLRGCKDHPCVCRENGLYC